MTLIQAVLIALFTYLGWIATPWLGGQGISYHVFGKPLVAGLIVGLIMGDVRNGIIIGATINALYIGAVTPGGAMASDINIAGYVGTALALSTGVSAEMAVSIAVSLMGLPFVLSGVADSPTRHPPPARLQSITRSSSAPP